MDEDYNDIPLATTSITLQLEIIQKRCSELLQEPDALSELSLEDPLDVPDKTNPYNLG